VPLSCEGRTVAPVAIDILPPKGAAVPRTADYIRNAAIENVLPGTKAPAGSVAARFPLQQIRPADRIKITYAGPACPEATIEVLLPLKFAPLRGTEMPPPSLPAGANPEQNRVLLQVLIDLDGAMQSATYIGGPVHLGQAAIDAVKKWRAEPARVNGAPVATAMLVEVEFK
jgi:TonB family protein